MTATAWIELGDDGRTVTGCIARFDVPIHHSAVVYAPRSKCSYCRFHRFTTYRPDVDEPDRLTPIDAGRLTMGELAPRSLDAMATMRFYDMLLGVGEVWVHETDEAILFDGVLFNAATDDITRTAIARLTTPTAHWCQVDGNLELVAITLLTNPGFPRP